MNRFPDRWTADAPDQEVRRILFYGEPKTSAFPADGVDPKHRRSQNRFGFPVIKRVNPKEYGYNTQNNIVLYVKYNDFLIAFRTRKRYTVKALETNCS